MIKIEKNVVIAALARDCAESLNKNIPLIEELRKRFSWSQVVVIENDSIDSTKEILFTWEKNSKGIKIISQDFGNKTIPDQTIEMSSPTTSLYRIEKMALYRNMYMEYIDMIEHKIDYVIVIDIDIKKFSVDGLLNSIVKVNQDWGGIFSNGVTTRKFLGFTSKIYYDIFAIYEYPISDFFSYSDDSLKKSFISINKNIKQQKFYNIVSAFGGVGIYKYEAIRLLRYKALANLSNKNEGVCEHIPFNMAIVNSGYKNYIARDFLLEYGTHNFGLVLKSLLPSNFFNFMYKLFSKRQ